MHPPNAVTLPTRSTSPRTYSKQKQQTNGQSRHTTSWLEHHPGSASARATPSISDTVAMPGPESGHRIETGNCPPNAAQEMAQIPGPKTERPKSRAQKMVSNFVEQGRSQTVWLHPCATKIVPRKRSSKKCRFQQQTQPKKNASNPRLRAQALSANRQTAFSTRKTYRREPDVKWEAPEPQQHTEPYKQNHELKNQ